MAAAAPKPTIKDRQRRLREDAILDAARWLLTTKGFTEMTLDDVIGEVGISKPTFYAHFVSKEQLGVQVMLRAMEEAGERLAALAAKLPPADAVKAMIGWVFDRHYGPANAYDFSGAPSLFSDPALRAAEQRLAEALAALIACGQSDGSIRAGVPPLLIANTLHSILKDSAYEDASKKGVLDVAAFKSDVTMLLLGA